MLLRLIKSVTLSVFVLSAMGCQNTTHAESTQRWWPVQKAPAGVVKSIPHEDFESISAPEGQTNQGHYGSMHTMVQSLSGLAAQAVNKGRSDEMIWIEMGGGNARNQDYAMWYDRIKEKLGFEERGTFKSWDMVKRFKDKGIVDSYVLYRYDYSKRSPYVKSDDADHSLNAATMAAGVEGAILIEEAMEPKAKELGLKLAYDARDKTLKQVFDEYKDRLNRNNLVAIDPKTAHTRAFAVAYKSPVNIGLVEPMEEMLKWLEPLSPIVGYLWGDEREETSLVTQYGHFITATNWSMNMPLLIAGSQEDVAVKVNRVDPTMIDYTQKKASAFAITDGDNHCWLMGNFTNSKYYWANKTNGDVPFCWTSCFANLSQVSSVTTEHLLKTIPENSCFIEYGGGYQYPDTFAIKLENRKELLEKFAKRVWQRMDSMGIGVFGFLTEDFDSPDAIEAYQVYAENMPGLVGMIAVQYYPYEGGPNDIIWVKNKAGVEIPVVRASFALWANYNTAHGGTPNKVARLINEDAKKDTSYNWTVVHAWSAFKDVEGDDENAQNGNYGNPNHAVGPEPVKWIVEKLDDGIKAVTIEELLWLIRMEHDPEQTQMAIKELSRNN
jgi:hypothetical protein